MRGSQSRPSSLIPSCGYGQSNSRATASIIEHKEKGDVYTVQKLRCSLSKTFPRDKDNYQSCVGVNEPQNESCRTIRRRRGDSRSTERILAWVPYCTDHLKA
ncbi:hypothetical protein ROHU_031018 [Labeo rohita]|uniref:Uncharacterized protein n=1 Tax=Labeo rohita TaxID=84645 RepID=A0A498LX02_LABRO|nr:hypothetical protein ROHU_031018 [Labeo rohita]